MQCDAKKQTTRSNCYSFITCLFTSPNVCCAWCRSPFAIRVPIVSKLVQDEARKSIVDEHLPLCGLQLNLGGLAREDEIAIANVNWRKQKDQERKDAKSLHIETDEHVKSTAGATKENKKPATKRKQSAKK